MGDVQSNSCSQPPKPGDIKMGRILLSFLILSEDILVIAYQGKLNER